MVPRQIALLPKFLTGNFGRPDSPCMEIFNGFLENGENLQPWLWHLFRFEKMGKWAIQQLKKRADRPRDIGPKVGIKSLDGNSFPGISKASIFFVFFVILVFGSRKSGKWQNETSLFFVVRSQDVCCSKLAQNLDLKKMSLENFGQWRKGTKRGPG